MARRRLRLRTTRAVVLALAGFAVAGTARAQDPPPATVQRQYSPYEQETIRMALEAKKDTLETEPEGKTLEAIEVVSLEVFEERDPIPRFFNIFHATTREYVVARESLVARGEPYQQVMVDETARNLRTQSQLSLVIPLAVKGSAPDKVRLLLVTKDVWSLRLNWDIGIGPGGLERLVLTPTESNLAGTHQSLSVGYLYLPRSSTVGVSYSEPRLAGTRLAFSSQLNVVFGNTSGKPEGSIGSIAVNKPLFSAKEEWAYGTSSSWSDSVIRRYVDAQLAGFLAKDVAGPNNIVPYQYRGRLITQTAYLTRSFGWAVKNDFTVGAEANKREYLVEDVAAVNPAAVAEFVRTRVPGSDTRAGPYVQWHGYRTEFTRVLDFETLALQEDFRLGHDLLVRAYPVTTALGSSRDFLGVLAAAQYTVPISDGLVRGSISSTTEAESSRVSDAAVGANFRFMSPQTKIGRVVFDGAFVNRYRNFLNRLDYLGGDSRLRGYPSAFFVGKDLVSTSLEFRSRPVEILSCQLGGVAFYDAGDALNGLDHLFSPRNSFEGIHHSVGVGARALFPQFDRIVLRADVGVPVGSQPSGVNPIGFYVTFGQAFGLANVSASANTAAGGALGQ